MDWLEDTEHFETAHVALDAAGREVRTTFGCELTFSEGRYWQDCPVALAHTRLGLSPGFVVRSAECSICGRDPWECNHITGRMYDGQLCVRVVTEIEEIMEVSLVPPPRSRSSTSVTGSSAARLWLGCSRQWPRCWTRCALGAATETRLSLDFNTSQRWRGPSPATSA